MASLSQFTSELRTRDVSKPNMFYVEIAAPNLISSDKNSVSMWCDMAHTPQVTILTQDDYIEAGTRRKYAYDQSQSNLTLSFYLDQNYKIKHFFDKWKLITIVRHYSNGKAFVDTKRYRNRHPQHLDDLILGLF